MHKRHSISSEALCYADLILKIVKLRYPGESQEGRKLRQQGKVPFGGTCYRFLTSQSKGAEVVVVLGHSRRLYQTVGRGRRLAWVLYDKAYFTFFSLRGNKDPDLSSLICGSTPVVGSTKFSTPTSLTVHFWNTWTVEKSKGESGKWFWGERQAGYLPPLSQVLNPTCDTVSIVISGTGSSSFATSEKINHHWKKWSTTLRMQKSDKSSQCHTIGHLWGVVCAQVHVGVLVSPAAPPWSCPLRPPLPL